MYTPSHVLLSLATLRRGRWNSLVWPIVLGALIADLPMFGFYFYQRWFGGAAEERIWGQLYFLPEWQLFFDVFNSIPVAFVLLVVCAARGTQAGAAFAASWLLHLVFDLPLHHDDAHRHFLPLSDFRFESPVSYWDPGRFGAYASAAEIALLVACGFRVAGRSEKRWPAVVVGLWVALSVAAWVAVYGFGLAPTGE